MTRLKVIVAGLAMVLMAQSPALAMDTARTYSSGLLVGLFVGFCALIVVVQLVPTLMLLVGAVRGFFRKSPDQKLGQGV